MTTANQASEDELKERIGNLHAYNFDGDDVTVKVMVDEDILESIAKYVKALIRTEKLKLLAEVRERVIGEVPSKMNTDNWKYDRRVAELKLWQHQAIDNKIKALEEV